MSNNEDGFDKTSIVPSDTLKVKLAQADEAPPALVLLVGPAPLIGKQWLLEKAENIIGRADSSDIQVDDRSISKSHAKVSLYEGEVTLIDLESTNKTIINNKILKPLLPHELKNNDQIKAGNVIFKFLEKGNIETMASAQTFEAMQTDALTGVLNRAALNSRAKEAFQKTETLQQPLSIVAFDIDYFKKVNDTYGHQAGDYILTELSKVVRDKLIRENDVFARYGGEEFCLVLSGSNLKTAEEVAERVRHTIEQHRFVFQGQAIPVTLSAGVATRLPKDVIWEDIFQRADVGLYESKKTGRNKVTSK